MNLKEFVETTLVQIAEGIAGANLHLQQSETGAVINPSETYGGIPKDAIKSVDFDVALTVTEETSSKDKSATGGKAGILAVASVAANLDSETAGSNRTEAISRVRFSVMMQQPANVKIKQHQAVPPSKSGWNG